MACGLADTRSVDTVPRPDAWFGGRVVPGDVARLGRHWTHGRQARLCGSTLKVHQHGRSWSDGLGGTLGCFKRQAGADARARRFSPGHAWDDGRERPCWKRGCAPSLGGAWRSPRGRMKLECGVRHQREWGQVAPLQEGWALARQVKMTHRLEGPRRARLGMLWMEGAQGGATQRAVLPWADRMTWMQTPAEGARASLWAAWNDREGNRTWSVHAAWAPSQQVAFRCALRLSWEA